jgi:glycerol-3-phosphate dehydrogenase
VLPGGTLDSVGAAIDAAARATGDAALGEHLVRAYGSRWPAIAAELAAPGGAERVVDGLPYTIGELRYAVRSELACTLGDLLVRRTHVAFETRDHGRAAAPHVLAAVSGLGDFATAGALAAYEREIERIFTID